MRKNAPLMPGGWAPLELTDALNLAALAKGVAKTAIFYCAQTQEIRHLKKPNWSFKLLSNSKQTSNTPRTFE